LNASNPSAPAVIRSRHVRPLSPDRRQAGDRCSVYRKLTHYRTIRWCQIGRAESTGASTRHYSGLTGGPHHLVAAYTSVLRFAWPPPSASPHVPVRVMRTPPVGRDCVVNRNIRPAAVALTPPRSRFLDA
jgi:hypothetical protein